jgi:CrcB protein
MASSLGFRLLGLAVFGALGIWARYFCSVAFEKVWGLGGFWATLAVNVLGSFLAGFLFVLAAEHRLIAEHWRVVLAVGFLGGFTTFSAYSLEAFRLLESGDWKSAFLYAVASPVLGVCAAFFGILVGRFFPASGILL